MNLNRYSDIHDRVIETSEVGKDMQHVRIVDYLLCL